MLGSVIDLPSAFGAKRGQVNNLLYALRVEFSLCYLAQPARRRREVVSASPPRPSKTSEVGSGTALNATSRAAR